MNTRNFLLLNLFLLSLSSCSEYDNKPIIIGHSHGFWCGILHGLLSPFTFLMRIFNEKIVVMSMFNDGFTYNLGFTIGFIITIIILFNAFSNKIE